MKKIYTIILTICAVIFINQEITAQIYQMPTGGHWNKVRTSSGTFYDNGGPGGNYTASSRDTITFYPMDNSYLQIKFESMDLGYDTLYIYDGPTANPTYDYYIMTLTGSYVPDSFYSTNPTGAITFVLSSKTAAPGWSATIKPYNNLGLRVNVDFQSNLLQCHNVLWSSVLMNVSNSSLEYNYNSRYINEWLIDGVKYSGYNPPDDTIKDGQHNYVFYALDTHLPATYDTVGKAQGSFFSESYKIVSSSGSQACPNEQIYFHLNKQGSPYINWNYDSTSYYSNNAFHTYTKAGTYKVKAAFTNYCTTDTLTFSINITNNAVSTPDIITSGGNFFCPGDNITYSTNGTYNSYLWDFGDGATASGNTVNHIYNTSGDKTVTLKVQNTCNNSVLGANTNILHIDTGIMANISFEAKPRYEYNCSIEPIQFIAQGVGNYSWDFGDSTKSTLTSPIHIYSEQKEYTVTLNATNGCGKKAYPYTISVYPSRPEMPLFVSFKLKNSNGLIQNSDDTIIACIGRTVEIVNDSKIMEPVTYKWLINGIPNGSLNSCFVNSDVKGTFEVKLVATTAMCGTENYKTINVVFTDTIKPETDLFTFPPKLCANEKVYFFDNEFKPERNYTYDITTSDGDNITGIKNLADLNLNALYAKSATQTFSYVFTVKNECNNSVSLKDTVIVNKDASAVPFYYVSNSTMPDVGNNDYSKRLSPSDMEINVTVKMSSWVSTMDSSVYIYFFKNKYDSIAGSPIGFVKAKGNLTNGVPVKAFLRYESGMKTYGIAAAYYCDSTNIDNNTNSRGIPGLYSYPFVEGAKITLNNINLYAPKCNPSKLVGTWHGTNLYGEKMIATFKTDSTYLIYRESYGRYGDYDLVNNGTYSENLGYYYLYSPDCGNYQQYTVNFSGDTMQCTPYPPVYPCSSRSLAFENITYIKGNPDTKDNYSSCAGDLISFKAAGGTSYLWDFGDGTIAKEQYPIHSYASPGIYNAKAIITNACGRKDTVISPVKIDTINKPSKIGIYADNYSVQAGGIVNFYLVESEENRNISTRYAWSLNGKVFGTDKQASYAFMTPGYYEVVLKVFNGCGVDSAYQSVNVEAASCYATFITRNIEPLSYEFESPLKGAQQYTWTFDGETPINSTSSIITHKFSQVAEHIINLKVTLVDGSSCDYTSKVNDASCDANFNSVSLTNKIVEFTGYSDITSDVVSIWNWDFGDGTTGSGKTITHTFPAVGYYYITLSSKGNFCKSSISKWIYAEGAPCVQPTFSKVRTGSNISFNINNPVDGTSYSWDYGDGSNYQYGNSVNHAYVGDDVYYISVYSYDSVNLCSEYFTDTVIIGNAGCMAYFSYYNDYDNHIEFYNYSTTGNYLWNFGDGNTSKEANPTHNYAQKGIYEVSLVVSDGQCSRKLTSTVVAGKFECQANFTYTIGADRTVTFKNTSTGAPTSFYWDFNDYYSSNDTNAVHKFEEDGIYNVYFSVYNNLTNCFDEIYKEIKIGNISNLTSANFIWSYGADSKTINFNNKSSSNVTNWYWTFGDGTYTSNTTGENVSHSYISAGVYDVCLTVYNSSNNTNDKKCDKVTAGELTCNVDALFTYMMDTKNDSVRFTDKSTGKYDTRSWDFGDGTTSSEVNPTHKYKTPGFYLVSLAVKQSNTYCIDYYADFIQVGAVDCKAEFSYVTASDGSVQFKNASKTSGSANYYWYFDDGDYSTDANPNHKFTNGMHYVFLTVADATGTCMNFKDEQIQIGEVDCSAEFSTFVDISNLTVSCKNKTIGKSTDYYWYFGDGSVSNDTSPIHKFDYPGYYKISLTTYDANSWCMDNYETEILVGNPGIDCQADFFYKVDNTSKKIKFSDNSKGDIVSYLWDFGDDTIPASTRGKYPPEHTFNAGGYYNVCLTVTNKLGISNMNCKWVKVAADKNTDCVADFAYKVTPDKKMVKVLSKSLGNPNSFIWDFGDENQSLKNDSSTHTYTDTGYYLVSLNIKTANGCESNTYKLINVGKQNKKIFANFGYDAKHYDYKAGGYPVDFGGAGIGDNSRLRWTFGDGSENSSSMTPAHVYLNPGKYEVCLEYADTVTKQSVKTCNWITTQEKCQGDSIKPVAKCKDTTIVITGAYLDIDPRSIDNSSTDDCGIYTLSLDNKRFTSANVGDNLIHLTVTDYNKNTNTCPATVHVMAGADVKNAFVAGFKAYPNPVESNVTISYNLIEANNIELAIFDLVGKRISTIATEEQNAGLKTLSYDASYLKSGSYIIQLKTASGNTSRIMIIKK